MKRWIVVAALVVVLLAWGFGSWVTISVGASGQFAVLTDGTFPYTHQLTTW